LYSGRVYLRSPETSKKIAKSQKIALLVVTAIDITGVPVVSSKHPNYEKTKVLIECRLA
jgi:hypothetical protein